MRTMKNNKAMQRDKATQDRLDSVFNLQSNALKQRLLYGHYASGELPFSSLNEVQIHENELATATTFNISFQHLLDNDLYLENVYYEKKASDLGSKYFSICDVDDVTELSSKDRATILRANTDMVLGISKNDARIFSMAPKSIPYFYPDYGNTLDENYDFAIMYRNRKLLKLDSNTVYVQKPKGTSATREFVKLVELANLTGVHSTLSLPPLPDGLIVYELIENYFKDRILDVGVGSMWGVLNDASFFILTNQGLKAMLEGHDELTDVVFTNTQGITNYVMGGMYSIDGEPTLILVTETGAGDNKKSRVFYVSIGAYPLLFDGNTIREITGVNLDGVNNAPLGGILNLLSFNDDTLVTFEKGGFLQFRNFMYGFPSTEKCFLESETRTDVPALARRESDAKLDMPFAGTSRYTLDDGRLTNISWLSEHLNIDNQGWYWSTSGKSMTATNILTGDPVKVNDVNVSWDFTDATECHEFSINNLIAASDNIALFFTDVDNKNRLYGFIPKASEYKPVPTEWGVVSNDDGNTTETIKSLFSQYDCSFSGDVDDLLSDWFHVTDEETAKTSVENSQEYQKFYTNSDSAINTLTLDSVPVVLRYELNTSDWTLLNFACKPTDYSDVWTLRDFIAKCTNETTRNNLVNERFDGAQDKPTTLAYSMPDKQTKKQEVAGLLTSMFIPKVHSAIGSSLFSDLVMISGSMDVQEASVEFNSDGTDSNPGTLTNSMIELEAKDRIKSTLEAILGISVISSSMITRNDWSDAIYRSILLSSMFSTYEIYANSFMNRLPGDPEPTQPTLVSVDSSGEIRSAYRQLIQFEQPRIIQSWSGSIKYNTGNEVMHESKYYRLKANSWSQEQEYSADDYVIKEQEYYKAKSDIDADTDWIASNWKKVAQWTKSSAYAKNAEVYYSGKFYKAKNAIAANTNWSSSNWTELDLPWEYDMWENLPDPRFEVTDMSFGITSVPYEYDGQLSERDLDNIEFNSNWKDDRHVDIVGNVSFPVDGNLTNSATITISLELIAGGNPTSLSDWKMVEVKYLSDEYEFPERHDDSDDEGDDEGDEMAGESSGDKRADDEDEYIHPTLTISHGPAIATIVGNTVEFTVTATGVPVPTITMNTEHGAIFENGTFTFTPSSIGTYEFIFTASNSEGTDTSTITIIATADSVTIPEVSYDGGDDRSAIIKWTPCTNITSYTLQLASDDQFTSGSIIDEYVTNKTNYYLLDLAPECTYFIRVKGAAGWSNVAMFNTGSDSSAGGGSGWGDDWDDDMEFPHGEPFFVDLGGAPVSIDVDNPQEFILKCNTDEGEYSAKFSIKIGSNLINIIAKNSDRFYQALTALTKHSIFRKLLGYTNDEIGPIPTYWSPNIVDPVETQISKQGSVVKGIYDNPNYVNIDLSNKTYKLEMASNKTTNDKYTMSGNLIVSLNTSSQYYVKKLTNSNDWSLESISPFDAAPKNSQVKLPFTVKFRAQISTGEYEYKVVENSATVEYGTPIVTDPTIQIATAVTPNTATYKLDWITSSQPLHGFNANSIKYRLNNGTTTKNGQSVSIKGLLDNYILKSCNIPFEQSDDALLLESQLFDLLFGECKTSGSNFFSDKVYTRPVKVNDSGTVQSSRRINIALDKIHTWGKNHNWSPSGGFNSNGTWITNQGWDLIRILTVTSNKIIELDIQNGDDSTYDSFCEDVQNAANTYKFINPYSAVNNSKKLFNYVDEITNVNVGIEQLKSLSEMPILPDTIFTNAIASATKPTVALTVVNAFNGLKLNLSDAMSSILYLPEKTSNAKVFESSNALLHELLVNKDSNVFTIHTNTMNLALSHINGVHCKNHVLFDFVENQIPSRMYWIKGQERDTKFLGIVGRKVMVFNESTLRNEVSNKRISKDLQPFVPIPTEVKALPFDVVKWEPANTSCTAMVYWMEAPEDNVYGLPRTIDGQVALHPYIEDLDLAGFFQVVDFPDVKHRITNLVYSPLIGKVFLTIAGSNDIHCFDIAVVKMKNDRVYMFNRSEPGCTLFKTRYSGNSNKSISKLFLSDRNERTFSLTGFDGTCNLVVQFNDGSLHRFTFTRDLESEPYAPMAPCNSFTDENLLAAYRQFSGAVINDLVSTDGGIALFANDSFYSIENGYVNKQDAVLYPTLLKTFSTADLVYTSYYLDNHLILNCISTTGSMSDLYPWSSIDLPAIIPELKEIGDDFIVYDVDMTSWSTNSIMSYIIMYTNKGVYLLDMGMTPSWLRYEDKDAIIEHFKRSANAGLNAHLTSKHHDKTLLSRFNNWRRRISENTVYDFAALTTNTQFTSPTETHGGYNDNPNVSVIVDKQVFGSGSLLCDADKNPGVIFAAVNSPITKYDTTWIKGQLASVLVDTPFYDYFYKMELAPNGSQLLTHILNLNHLPFIYRHNTDNTWDLWVNIPSTMTPYMNRIVGSAMNVRGGRFKVEGNVARIHKNLNNSALISDPNEQATIVRLYVNLDHFHIDTIREAIISGSSLPMHVYRDTDANDGLFDGVQLQSVWNRQIDTVVDKHGVSHAMLEFKVWGADEQCVHLRGEMASEE